MRPYKMVARKEMFPLARLRNIVSRKGNIGSEFVWIVLPNSWINQARLSSRLIMPTVSFRYGIRGLCYNRCS